MRCGVKKIVSIPSSYYNQLVSLSQGFKNSTIVITNSNQSLTKQKLPEPDTDIALHATFRLISKDIDNKTVMLEPFDLPGMIVCHQEPDQPLTIVNSSSGDAYSVFYWYQDWTEVIKPHL
ncbi:hypothetical protein MTR_4g065790 [Medicago truncatula]|uniref:Uncharacterized protein n=1 Tax=Medicago truncatula TaxID=3880 RepID=A0A072UME0_MEDTR|nr:hypothetical protein MTR_4g065790 [Medicago truncatula]